MWPVIATWGLAGQSELVQVGEGLQDEESSLSPWKLPGGNMNR